MLVRCSYNQLDFKIEHLEKVGETYTLLTSSIFKACMPVFV